MTIVEAAFALPILLMFIFGLVDLGMWVFNANQATNAARDGARAAILRFEEADIADPDSVDHEAVVAAALRRLDGKPAEVTVRCVDPEGEELTSCAAAEPDLDSVRVDVDWDWTFLTPIAGILGYEEGRARAHGTATMAIVGLPFESAPGVTTTTMATTTPEEGTIPEGEEEVVVAEACEFTSDSFAVSPSSVKTTGSGSKQLVDELNFTLTSNGSLDCRTRFEVILGPTGTDGNPVSNKSQTFACGCGDGPEHLGSYTGSTNIWNITGSWTAVLEKDGEVVGRTTFTVVSG